MKQFKILCAVFLCLFSILLILNVNVIYKYKLIEATEEAVREELYEELYNDFLNYKEKFENVRKLFRMDKIKYEVIDIDTYSDNENVNFILNELGYIKIYRDHRGNIYFQKFEKELTSISIVWEFNSSGLNFINSESIYLDDSMRWIIYYSYGI